MSDRFLPFDEVRDRAVAVLDGIEWPEDMPTIYLVRSLVGRLGISVSENARPRCSNAVRDALHRLADALRESLGTYARADQRPVLWVDEELLNTVRDTALEIRSGVFWVDRVMVGEDWWTVGEAIRPTGPARYTLYGVKGGVGRSTTATVLAWHLARAGERVLVVDLDIESPGLASAVLEERSQPTFGVVDWFVEDLVGQGDRVVEQMVATPAWSQDTSGDVWVAPAHGRDPGEYLAKLGRAYMTKAAEPWGERLQRLLAGLEGTLDPTAVVLESRSGLHDIAAATVTDIDADVLLFAVDSPSTWSDYGILFDHWSARGLAPRIRDRLSIVSALTPEFGSERYLERFRENAWNLFRDRLYDSLLGPDDPTDAVSYDLSSEEAPHSPLMIRWNQGLAAGASLRHLEETAVDQAYWPFLKRFDRMHSRTAEVIPLEGTSEVREQVTTETLRIALGELPEETRHGRPPKPAELYLPPSHRKALDPNVMLVTGMRGSGKTFWWSALQDRPTRRLLASLDRRLEATAQSEVRAGFGVTDALSSYPGRDGIRSMMAAGATPRIVWRTVHARHLADSRHPLRTQDAWPERSRYMAENPQDIARLFRDRDDELERSDRYSLVLFDGLDRSAESWSVMFSLIRGLLEHALDMRSYRRLRAKVFLRSDQADVERVADFPDASKILSSAVELTWPRRDLFGMLWQYLGNGSQGELVRPWLAKGDWPTDDIEERRIFRIPATLAVDEDVQRELFHSIAGPWMGRDPRRGFPYTWIPNHLGDAEGRVSPRSFIAALRTAANETGDRHRDHDQALHYDSIKRGVQEASKIRVQELREDYPWVDRLLSPLSGFVVPCAFEEIESTWEDEGVIDTLNHQIGQDEVKLPPRHIDRGASGVREDLESLGVFRRLADGRVDLPDVFRVGYGLGRRGGVKPVR